VQLLENEMRVRVCACGCSKISEELLGFLEVKSYGG
jgi:hypothetical protein